MSYRRTTLPNSRLRHMAPLIIWAVLCFYFAFYLLFAPRGYPALQRLEARFEDTRHDYQTLKTKREALEADVKLMRPNSLDPDMADEQARRVLGYSKKDEIVVDLP